jgi:hypothetical protein
MKTLRQIVLRENVTQNPPLDVLELLVGHFQDSDLALFTIDKRELAIVLRGAICDQTQLSERNPKAPGQILGGE